MERITPTKLITPATMIGLCWGFTLVVLVVFTDNLAETFMRADATVAASTDLTK